MAERFLTVCHTIQDVSWRTRTPRAPNGSQPVTDDQYFGCSKKIHHLHLHYVMEEFESNLLQITSTLDAQKRQNSRSSFTNYCAWASQINILILAVCSKFVTMDLVKQPSVCHEFPITQQQNIQSANWKVVGSTPIGNTRSFFSVPVSFTDLLSFHLKHQSPFLKVSVT